MLELYYASESLCSQKVKLVLAEKNLEWKGHLLNLLTFENLQPSYMRLNPRGVVPTLIHNSRILTDSAVIVRYLDENFPEPRLVSTEPESQEAMQNWIELQNQLPMREIMYGNYPGLTGIVLQRSLRLKQKVLSQRIDEANHELQALYKAKLEDINQWLSTISDKRAIAHTNEKIAPMLDRLEAQLAETEWLCGTTYSLADTVWTAVLNRLEELKFSYLWANGARPHLNAYLNRVKRRPSFKAAIQEDALPLPMLLAGLRKTFLGF